MTKPRTEYSFAGGISVEHIEGLRPKAQTKIHMSEVLAMRIRRHADRMKRLAQATANKARGVR